MMLLSVAVSAQTGQLEGTIKLKDADGKVTPVQGATIDIYRTDIKAHYKAETDKNGRYIRIGLPLQGNYIVVVSGPGMQPTWEVLRLAQVPVRDFTVSPGNGEHPTLEQVQAAMKGSPMPGPGGMSKEDREKAEKARAEQDAKRKEAEALQSSFDSAREHFIKGVEFKKAQNYDAAMAELQLATNVDTTKHAAFIEVVHKANAHLAEVHSAKGTEVFNKNRKATPEAKPHFDEAVKAIKKAIEVAGTDTSPNINNDLLTYYNIFATNGKILVQHFGQVDLVDEMVPVLDKAQALDQTNKLKWQLLKGELYRLSSRTDEAVAAFKAVLVTDPNNADAMYGLGLTLVSSGDMTKLQEAANYLSDFVAKAPASDPRVAEVNASLQALKQEFKVEAEKPARRGRRP
jgi:tetratricopeptide (TPR) repeat protein